MQLYGVGAFLRGLGDSHYRGDHLLHAPGAVLRGHAGFGNDVVAGALFRPLAGQLVVDLEQQLGYLAVLATDLFMLGRDGGLIQRDGTLMDGDRQCIAVQAAEWQGLAFVAHETDHHQSRLGQIGLKTEDTSVVGSRTQDDAIQRKDRSIAYGLTGTVDDATVVGGGSHSEGDADEAE